MEVPLSIAVVPIEIISPIVVGDIEVGIAVVVVVLPSGGEGLAVIILIQAQGNRGIGETPVAIISEKNIATAVIGIVIGDGTTELSGVALRIAGIDAASRIAGGVDVEVAIEIEIAGSEPTTNDRPCQIPRHLRGNFAKTTSLGSGDASENLSGLPVPLTGLNPLDFFFQMTVRLHQVFHSVEIKVREQESEGE